MIPIAPLYSSQPRPVLTGRKGAIAAAHPWAVAAGEAMLRDCGSAIDALIAAQAVLCVLMPDACGIGGDMFAILQQPDGQQIALNGGGASPAVLENWAVSGANSITTPGIVDAWTTLAARWGRLPLAQLLTPAIELARDGFRLPESLATPARAQRQRLIENGAANWNLLALRPGALWQQPALADLLIAIGHHGGSAFYQGPIAAAIARSVQALGGKLAESDLAAHRTELEPPLILDWNGIQLALQPPMAQGVLLGMVLQAFDKLGPLPPALHDHALIELSEASFAHRDHIAAGASLLRHDLPVDLTRALGRGGPRAYLHTAGVAVSDASGLCVSSLVSVFDDFGSCVFVPEGGFTLNNRGAGFTQAPNHPAPGKRPVHTLAPCLLRAGDTTLALATPGADGQIQTLAQILAACCRNNQDLAAAIAAPRWRSQNGALLIEANHPGQAKLALLGHALQPIAPGDMRFGGVVAAGFNSQPFACADWRRENWAGVV